MEYSVREIEDLVRVTSPLIEESVEELRQGNIDKAFSGLQSMVLLASLHGRM
jgi:hypothetical protein